MRRRLRIGIVTPADSAATSGNRVTARRWARILRGFGHRVTVTDRYRGQPFDLLVALHARKSAPAVVAFRRARPRAPVLVALTGTDVYGDVRGSAAARRSLALATRLIALQPLAARELPPSLRDKVRVVRQSAVAPRARRPRRDVFEVCLPAHLRRVKDPLRAAAAARLLPPESRVRIVHLGAVLEPALARRARREMARNPRYRWLGERPRAEALRRLARSHLLLITSRLEGGSNTLTEALAAGVPVVSSRIPGVIGTLGPGYPGYFRVGHTKALASLLRRVERDPDFRQRLAAWCRRLRHLVSPARERRAWRALLADVFRAARPA